jgi:hypothetical protein
MPLKLYRRHRKECEAGHLEDACTGEVGGAAARLKEMRLPDSCLGNVRRTVQPPADQQIQLRRSQSRRTR